MRAHVFLCMLAYYVEWHMRRALAPMLYDDEEREALLSVRSNPVAKAPRSDSARLKEGAHRTPDGLAVHSFQSLLADLGTLCLNTLVTALNPNYEITELLAERLSEAIFSAPGWVGAGWSGGGGP